MAKQGISDGGLRVGVKGGGCSGLSYTFAWEREPRLGDEVFEGPEGAKIFVDKKSHLFLNGTTLDYDTALLTQGLRVPQPEREVDLRLRQLLRRMKLQLRGTRHRFQRSMTPEPFRPFAHARVPQLRRRRSGRRALLPAVQPHPRARPARRLLHVPRPAAQAASSTRSDLERRFRELSRKFHPDYFYNASPAERLASLERSSYLNDAYRDAEAIRCRASSTCSRSKGLPSAQDPKRAPRRFRRRCSRKCSRSTRSSTRFASCASRAPIRDKLRGAPRNGAHADRREARRARAAAAGAERALGQPGRTRRAAEKRATLDALRERLLERNYINNLLATIERKARASRAASSVEP